MASGEIGVGDSEQIVMLTKTFVNKVYDAEEALNELQRLLNAYALRYYDAQLTEEQRLHLAHHYYTVVGIDEKTVKHMDKLCIQAEELLSRMRSGARAMVDGAVAHQARKAEVMRNYGANEKC